MVVRLASRAWGLVQSGKPIAERLREAERDATEAGQISLMTGGDPAATAGLEELVGVRATGAARPDSLAVYPAAPDTPVGPIAEQMGRRLRDRQAARAVLVGTAAERRRIEEGLRQGRVGVSSTIQTPSLDGGGSGLVARGLVRALGRQKLAAGRRYPKLRPVVASVVVDDAARRAGLVGLVPLPGADMPALFMIQLGVVSQLAALYQHPFGAERGAEAALLGGAAFGWRALGRSLSGAVPGAGWAVRGGLAYTSTRAIGEAARQRFERGRPLDLKEIDEHFTNVVERVYSR